MTHATNSFGELGERIAARWLERSGYKILARRFRAGRASRGTAAGGPSTIHEA